VLQEYREQIGRVCTLRDNRVQGMPSTQGIQQVYLYQMRRDPPRKMQRMLRAYLRVFMDRDYM